MRSQCITQSSVSSLHLTTRKVYRLSNPREVAGKLLQAVKKIAVIGATAILATSCATQPGIKMNDLAQDHPATTRFLAFAESASNGTPAEELIREYYTEKTQAIIAKQIGWYKLAYTSTYQFLKQGECAEIRISKTYGNRIQLDCIGELLVQSVIIDDVVEPAHLQVNMVKQNDQWYFDRAGYLYVDTGVVPNAYNRFGIRFDSELVK